MNPALLRTTVPLAVQNLCLPVLACLLCGCPAGKPASEVAEGKVVIKGSNTIGEELAPRLIAEYKKDQPKVAVELESKGTGSGVAALLAGQCDIAAASRVISPPELGQAQSNRVHLNCHMVGSYSVAVIVNSANPVADLSRDQVRDIFTGVVQNWKDVKGPDAAIHLCIRDPISGTYLGFRELAMEDKPYASGVKTFTNYAAIVQAVAADTNAIGYASFDLVQKSGIKAPTIRGVPAEVLSVAEGRYPYSRVLRLYTNKEKEAAPAVSFINFVQSSRGQAILAEMGFLPRP